MSERFLLQSLSIIECGRSNIIPRNPANALPAWLRDSRARTAEREIRDGSGFRPARQPA